MVLIACGAVYMVFSMLSSAPVAKPTKSERVIRSLAYENAISEAAAPKPKAEADAKPEDSPKPPPLPGEADAKPEPAAKPKHAAKPPAELPPDDGDQSAATASLPPGEDGDFSGSGEPLPWQTDDQTASMPDDGAGGYDPQAAAPGYGQEPYDPAAPADPYRQEPGPYDQARSDPYGAPPPDPYTQQPYGQPGADPYAQPGAAGDPYAQPGAPYGQPGGDPYAQQGQQGAPGEEWVQVMVSGTGMRSTAAEDAPMLFAFPYGRNLRVVSRHGEWVEVTDPKSAATGWMRASYLGPGMPPGQAYGQNEAYYEQPMEQRRPGLFRKGGFADMINRAFGGGHGN